MNYSKWSAILSLICAVALFISYMIAPVEPKGIIAVIIAVLYFGAIIVGLISIVLSILAFKNRELGFLKFVAPIVVFVILVIYLLVFLIMGLGLLLGP